MAKDKKKKKKTKHTNLVMPGAGKKTSPSQPAARRSIYRAANNLPDAEPMEQQPLSSEMTVEPKQPNKLNKNNKTNPSKQKAGTKQPFDVTNAPIDEDGFSALLGGAVSQVPSQPTKKGESEQAKMAKPLNTATGDTQPAPHKPKGQTTQFPAIKKVEQPVDSAKKQGTTQTKKTAKKTSKSQKKPRERDRFKEAVKAGKRKKRMRWVRIAAGAVVAVCLVLAYFAGVYSSLIASASNMIEDVKIGANGGSGFPNDFTVSGFQQAQSMGNNGIAALGDKDMAILSSSGKELLRIQHTYATPSIAAGPNRVCLYSRGSSEYILTNRSKLLQKTTTEDGEILFADISNNGSLLLATASQYRSTVKIFAPSSYEAWQWSWSSSEDVPISATFASNNKTLALACVNPTNAVMKSTIYIFNTTKTKLESAQSAAITIDGGVPVQMHFIKNKLLVVYDTGYAALYDKSGAELARYDYGGAVLHTASLTENGVALLFGSSFQDNTHMVYLNTALEVQGEISINDAIVTQAIVGTSGIYVLAGQEVLAYSKDFVQAESLVESEKNYAVVWGGEPILLNATGAISLKDLVQTEKNRQSTAQQSQASQSVPQSIVS